MNERKKKEREMDGERQQGQARPWVCTASNVKRENEEEERREGGREREREREEHFISLGALNDACTTCPSSLAKKKRGEDTYTCQSHRFVIMARMEKKAEERESEEERKGEKILKPEALRRSTRQHRDSSSELSEHRSKSKRRDLHMSIASICDDGAPVCGSCPPISQICCRSAPEDDDDDDEA